MIGMAALPIGKNHGTRAQGSNAFRNCQFVIHAHFELRVRQAQVFSMFDAQQSRRCGRFTPAYLDRTPSCPFRLR